MLLVNRNGHKKLDTGRRCYQRSKFILYGADFPCVKCEAYLAKDSEKNFHQLPGVIKIASTLCQDEEIISTVAVNKI